MSAGSLAGMLAAAFAAFVCSNGIFPRGGGVAVAVDQGWGAAGVAGFAFDVAWVPAGVAFEGARGSVPLEDVPDVCGWA